MQRHRQQLAKREARPRESHLLTQTSQSEYRRLRELWNDLRVFPREHLSMKPYCPGRGEQTDISLGGSLKLDELGEVYYPWSQKVAMLYSKLPS